MTATVNASTTAATTTRRHTWRTGDCSSWAIRTPVCSVSAPLCPLSTPGTVMSGPRGCAPPHPYGSAPDLLPFLGRQLPLEYLARCRDRDRVDEHDVAQPLVRGHVRVDGGHHRLRRQRGSGVVGLADDV